MNRKPVFKKRPVDEPSIRRRVNVLDLSREYGYWQPIRKSDRLDYIFCKCKCGTERDVHVYSLTSGKSKSCGCMRRKT